MELMTAQTPMREIEIFGIPALFTDQEIDPEEIGPAMHCYVLVSAEAGETLLGTVLTPVPVELSGEQMSQLYIMDEYPSDQAQFSVQGYSVAVKDSRLADALAALSEDKREIVLLSYFLDMTDQEIADSLNLVRSTVQYKRTSSLKEMKKRMEVIDDGERDKES